MISGGSSAAFSAAWSSSCITRSRSSAGAEHYRIAEDALRQPSICCQQFCKTACTSLCISWAVVDVLLVSQPPLGAGMTQNQSSPEYRGEKPCRAHEWERTGCAENCHGTLLRKVLLQNAKRRRANSLIADARRSRMQEIQYQMHQLFSDASSAITESRKKLTSSVQEKIMYFQLVLVFKLKSTSWNTL